MSWMDSWSRPSANSKIPPPLYLSHIDVPYCHTCGRVMTTKKSAKKSQEIKYCSERCRGRKPGAKDREIEQKIAALLNGDQDSGIETTAAKSKLVKGDSRMIITCDEIETIMFGSRFDPEKVYGRRKNRKSRALRDDKEWRSVDMESSSESEDDEVEMQQKIQTPVPVPMPAPDADVIPLPFNVSHVRPSQMESEINFSAGGGERSKVEKIEESATDLAKRREGAKRAEEREMVRRAARRAIVFGVELPRNDKAPVSISTTKDKSRRSRRASSSLDDEQETKPTAQGEVKKAEALMNGVVVEPSFAKGNWSLRWRE